MFYHYLVWLPLCFRSVGVQRLCEDVCPEEGDCETFCANYEIVLGDTRCERSLMILMILKKINFDNRLLQVPEVLSLITSNPLPW